MRRMRSFSRSGSLPCEGGEWNATRRRRSLPYEAENLREGGNSGSKAQTRMFSQGPRSSQRSKESEQIADPNPDSSPRMARANHDKGVFPPLRSGGGLGRGQLSFIARQENDLAENAEHAEIRTEGK